ncbi:hypothetical protein BDD12DRAFT_879321 [Trichophaea hybrida]|nr:hypothetical protein BDD12DRAFT_879321 [Trichophaea hybrida]
MPQTGVNLTQFGPPELLDHSNRQQEFIGVVLGFTVLAVFLVGARIYTRACLVKSLGPDDWTLLMGNVCLCVSTLTTIMYMHLTYNGYHVWDIPKHSHARDIEGQKWDLAMQLMYNPVLSWSKISLLLFYRRLTPNQTFQRWVYLSLYCTIGQSISTFISDLNQCVPIAHFYDKSIPGHCFNRAAFYFASAGISIFGDTWILCLPMPVFWGLQISLKRRLALMLLFAVGIIVVMVSCIRLYTLYRVMFLNKDKSYDSAPVWSAVELCVSQISCTIPALRPLFAVIGPKITSSVSLSNYKSPWRGYVSDSDRAARPGAGGNYGLEEMGSKDSKKVYGGSKGTGTTVNDSEEMIIGKSESEMPSAHTPAGMYDRADEETMGDAPVAVAR